MLSRSITMPSSNSDRSPLLTDDQFAIEEAQAALLARPELAAARACALEAMRNDPLAATDDGARLMENALDRWLSRVCLTTLMRAESRPVIVWCNQLAAYAWRGRSVRASAAAIDTPDFIYRFACIDGTQRYRLCGRAMAPAAGLLVQVTEDHPGTEGFAQPKNGADVASSAMFDTDSFERDAEGSFQITLGPERGNLNRGEIGVPHGALQLIFRDILNDWNENAHALTLTSLGECRRARPSDTALAQRVAQDFPLLVGFWLRLKDKFRGLDEANRPYGPTGRSGNWGYSLVSRFELRPDEALVVTLENVEARYFGVQIADVWMMLPDPRHHSSSLNRAQSRVGEDGTLTYIISPSDPGLANWLDTAGSREGYLLFRWITSEALLESHTLVRRFEVVSLAELASTLRAHPSVDLCQRKAELMRRRLEWERRVACEQPGRALQLQQSDTVS
jgi:hypothetical protein